VLGCRWAHSRKLASPHRVGTSTGAHIPVLEQTLLIAGGFKPDSTIAVEVMNYRPLMNTTMAPDASATCTLTCQIDRLQRSMQLLQSTSAETGRSAQRYEAL
jgi:hypothetical protein